MEKEITALRKQLHQAHSDLATMQLELGDVRNGARRMGALVSAARNLRDRWHGHPWMHEDVHEAGRQVIQAVREYDEQQSGAPAT